MAIGLLGHLNRVINQTVSEILDSQVIDKATHVISTFITSGVETVRDLTAEEPEEPGVSEVSESPETPETPETS